MDETLLARSKVIPLEATDRLYNHKLKGPLVKNINVEPFTI
jgi:hypothetical protein